MKTLKNIPTCTQGVQQMGLIVPTIKQTLFFCNKHGLMNWIEMLHLTKCCMK